MAHGYAQVYSHKVYHAQGFLAIEAASGKLVIDASKTLAGEGSMSGRAARARRTRDSTPCPLLPCIRPNCVTTALFPPRVLV